MTTTTLNINGVTLKDIVRLMKKEEAIVSYYNTKYNFDLALGSAKEIKEYENSLKRWDNLKSKKDMLTTCPVS